MTGDWLYGAQAPHTFHHAAPASGSAHWLAAAFVLGLVFAAGLHFGRRRGLKHLGQIEFNTRWRNVKHHRPW